MKVTASRFGALALVAGLLAASPAMALETAVAPEQSPATVTHNDPIVQKRLEVRAANQAHRANRAEARQVARSEVSQSRAERNEAVQDSRARAQQAINQAE